MTPQRPLAGGIDSVSGVSSLPRRWQSAAQSSGDPPQVSETVETVSQRRPGSLEAALFLARGPMSPARLAKAAGLSGVAECRRLLSELRGQLAGRGSALEIVEVAGGFRLVTRACFAPWIEALREEKQGSQSPAAPSRVGTETLAIVAYRQPVVRAEVEAIRGVGCGEVLRQLLDAGLLRIVGRSEELGKPLLYGTTDQFLELYGLASLDELPPLDEAAGSALPTTHNVPPSFAA